MNKSLDRKIEEARNALYQLEAEAEKREENPHRVWVFSSKEDNRGYYDLACAIARTEMEAEEAIEKEMSRIGVTNFDLSTFSLRVSYPLDKDFAYSILPIAWFSGNESEDLCS